MKTSFSNKISFILAMISIITILVLTVLIHFRYHITQIDMINNRLQVTSNTIANVVDNKIKSGMALAEQNDLTDYIKKISLREKIIRDINIVSIDNHKIKNLYKTGERKLKNFVLEKVFQKIQSSKTNDWSFTETSLKKKTNYFGVTIKTTTGNVAGAIVISYNGGLLEEQEQQEIKALYIRFGIASLIIILLSLIIGRQTTRTLEESLLCILNGLQKLKLKENNFDLTDIDDPSFKHDLRLVLKNTSHIQLQLKKIDDLLVSAMKEENHEEK